VRGTDISFDWSYRGFQACTLENEILRVTVLPQVGAKIHQMIFKPADRDLLYHHPRVEVRQPVFGGNVDNWWTGGIDECRLARPASSTGRSFLTWVRRGRCRGPPGRSARRR
jgi:hypothetical protein